MMARMSTRRYYTQQDREHWLTKFDQADSTAVAFCREHQLCYQTFLKWRKAGRESNIVSGADFIEIEVPTPPPAPPTAPRVELSFPGGLTLRIFTPLSPQP
jgi:hypothetical protein